MESYLRSTFCKCFNNQNLLFHGDSTTGYLRTSILLLLNNDKYYCDIKNTTKCSGYKKFYGHGLGCQRTKLNDRCEVKSLIQVCNNTVDISGLPTHTWELMNRDLPSQLELHKYDSVFGNIQLHETKYSREFDDTVLTYEPHVKEW